MKEAMERAKAEILERHPNAVVTEVDDGTLSITEREVLSETGPKPKAPHYNTRFDMRTNTHKRSKEEQARLQWQKTQRRKLERKLSPADKEKLRLADSLSAFTAAQDAFLAANGYTKASTTQRAQWYPPGSGVNATALPHWKCIADAMAKCAAIILSAQKDPNDEQNETMPGTVQADASGV